MYLQQRTVERGKFGVAEGGQRKEGRKVGKEGSGEQHNSSKSSSNANNKYL